MICALICPYDHPGSLVRFARGLNARTGCSYHEKLISVDSIKVPIRGVLAALDPWAVAHWHWHRHWHWHWCPIGPIPTACPTPPRSDLGRGQRTRPPQSRHSGPPGSWERSPPACRGAGIRCGFSRQPSSDTALRWCLLVRPRERREPEPSSSSFRNRFLGHTESPGSPTRQKSSKEEGGR